MEEIKIESGIPIWELVILDMRRRFAVRIAEELGRVQYDNGRNALQDAYEKALDLSVYLRQAIEEVSIAVAAKDTELAKYRAIGPDTPEALKIAYDACQRGFSAGWGKVAVLSQAIELSLENYRAMEERAKKAEADCDEYRKQREF